MAKDDAATGEITRLLRTVGDGASAADQLWERVYPELRRRAASLIRNERSNHTLSATAVVNEAYVRLASRMANEWEDRSHFYNVASGIMRHVLIDHARAHRADKRGGGARPTLLEESQVALDDDPAAILELDSALERLHGADPRLAQLVSLRFFGGLSTDETAEVLGITTRTLRRDWRKARAFLYADLYGHDDA